MHLESPTQAIAQTLRCHRFAMASQRAHGFATLLGSVAYAPVRCNPSFYGANGFLC